MLYIHFVFHTLRLTCTGYSEFLSTIRSRKKHPNHENTTHQANKPKYSKQFLKKDERQTKPCRYNAHKATRQANPQNIKVNNTYQTQNRQIQQHFSSNMKDNI